MRQAVYLPSVRVSAEGFLCRLCLTDTSVTFGGHQSDTCKQRNVAGWTSESGHRPVYRPSDIPAGIGVVVLVGGDAATVHRISACTSCMQSST